MNDNLIEAKATAVAICTAIGAFLGWKGIMALVWALRGLIFLLNPCPPKVGQGER